MKIAFFGTPLFARKILEQLLQKHEILAIITQPDRPFGRKQELKASEVKLLALEHNLPIFQPERLDQELLENLCALGAEIFVVVAFGQFFPSSFLNARLCLNVHASLLPLLRGASPLQEMIVEDKKNFGVSVMKMDVGMDSGEIMALSYLLSPSNLALETLAHELSLLGGKLLCKSLEYLEEIEGLKQIHCDATYCKKIKKEEGCVDFESGKMIVNKLLAFSSWPSVFLESGLKILKVDFEECLTNGKLGEICEIQLDGVKIVCKDGILKIYEVQPANKQKMSALDYIRGKRWEIGEIFC